MIGVHTVDGRTKMPGHMSAGGSSRRVRILHSLMRAWKYCCNPTGSCMDLAADNLTCSTISCCSNGRLSEAPRNQAICYVCITLEIAWSWLLTVSLAPKPVAAATCKTSESTTQKPCFVCMCVTHGMVLVNDSLTCASAAAMDN